MTDFAALRALAREEGDWAGVPMNDFRALVEAVDAARVTAPFLPPLHQLALNKYLAHFDFATSTS